MGKVRIDMNHIKLICYEKGEGGTERDIAQEPGKVPG
jgi:hypothetical protein